ncbi:hypothetical protein B0H17DRAFT_1181285 [Mycena rosella]|uniref:Uncharacterized protein n=1 Tax=Mycena rosella TaxID=1033263 RepID=A0AAD7GB97_MYCRO|nr:hypothetical protein B0H17DRAFT_1181285 [Mycena rosella]
MSPSNRCGVGKQKRTRLLTFPSPNHAAPAVASSATRAESTASVATIGLLIQLPSRAGNFADADTLNVDLGAFFDNTPPVADPPIPNPTGSGGPAVAVVASTPPTPDQAVPTAPAPIGAVKDFIDRVGLSDIPPKDKRSARATFAHTADGSSARTCTQSYLIWRDALTNVHVNLNAQITGVQSPNAKLQAAIAANARDICAASDRLEQVELMLNRTSATVDTINEALKTLILSVNVLATATAPAQAAVSVPPAPLPALLAPPASSFDSRMDNMEYLFQQLVSKRSRSPDGADDGRNVRTRVEDSTAPVVTAPAPIALAARPAPIPPTVALVAAPPPVLVAAPAPVIVAAPPAVVAAPPPGAVTAPPPPAIAAPPPPAIAAPPPPAIPAPPPAAVAAPLPVTIAAPPAIGVVAAPAPVAVTGVPPRSLRTTQPRRPTWARSPGAATSPVLPAARTVMRNYRARRGPDSNTIIACFEMAEIAS